MENNFTFFIYEKLIFNENSILLPLNLNTEEFEMPLLSPSKEILDKLADFIENEA